MTEAVDCVVIGAGAVGLAIAATLARAGRETIILEAAAAIGTGVSSRSSEVIHAGMYYREGSLRARHCVRGNQLLRKFLESHGVAHAMVGKLIVATNDVEEEQLHAIKARGEANGVDGLRFITGAAAGALEPALFCTAALESPATGIFDAHAYMLALLGEAEAHGAVLARQSPMIAGTVTGNGIALEIGGPEPSTLLARHVVNAAGLGATSVSATLRGLPPAAIPKFYLCKGSYFRLDGRQPFARLIYPVPLQAGLGIHYTMDLGGQGRFGPDVQWPDAHWPGTIDYTVDPARAAVFATAIRRYWPGLDPNRLQPAYAGIRPKIQAPDEPPCDFLIQGPADHRVAGLVALYGIESPGLTSSLAIAEQVAAMLC